MSRFARFRRRRGAVIVEFALIMPFMLLIVVGIIDFSRAYSQLNTINASLREAARYGAALSRPDTSYKQIKGEALRFSGAFGRQMDTSKVTVTYDGFQVAVSVTNYPITLPTLGGFLRVSGLDTLRVSRDVSFRWERTGMP
jgi:Flp pilus assembly protein TadG